jgi:cellulose synthase/poly-beta-1,6-N-acetylglucosamine synthase-like glycosyltransferase
MIRAWGWSFGIITDGKEPDKLAALIESIHAQRIPVYEILLAGELPSRIPTALDLIGVRLAQMKDAAQNGMLGVLRNAVCQLADYNHLVVLDDDMRLHPGWYIGMLQYGAEWDVLSCVIHNPDGSRFWDWKTHRDGENKLLDYTMTSTDISLTGGLTIMKARVFDHVQWPTDLGFYQGEDVEFSSRLKAAGMRIAFNPHSTVTHQAAYTQSGETWLKMFTQL